MARFSAQKSATDRLSAIGIGHRLPVQAVAVLLAVIVGTPQSLHAQSAATPASSAAAAPAQKAKAAGSGQQPAPPGPSKRDPAAAQASIEAAGKLLDGGKTDQAVNVLTSAISGGNLPPSIMAKALYLRGGAYRKQSKPALAIADLTSALWLKGGLSDADRADATQQRTAAYSEAGLGDQGQTSASGGTAPRKRADGTAAALAPNASVNTGGSGSGPFAGLFGGGADAAAPDETTASKPRRQRPVAGTEAATSPSAASAAAPQPAAPPSAAAAPASTPRIAAATVAPPAKQQAAAAEPARGAAQFQSRIALVRTRAEADAVVAKLKVQHAGALAEKSPSVGETNFGNMGAFFQVRVGPYPTAAEATALCGRLKGSGLDCVPVNN